MHRLHNPDAVRLSEGAFSPLTSGGLSEGKAPIETVEGRHGGTGVEMRCPYRPTTYVGDAERAIDRQRVYRIQL
jgi:hypothetical protein